MTDDDKWAAGRRPRARPDARDAGGDRHDGARRLRRRGRGGRGAGRQRRCGAPAPTASGTGASAASCSTSTTPPVDARSSELAAGADVVVEDFRPGELAARGLGYDDVAAANADVVYCSITGYGQTGSRRDRLGSDAAVAAHLGHQPRVGRQPRRADLPRPPGDRLLDRPAGHDRHPRLPAQPHRQRRRRPRRRLAARRRAGPVPDELVERAQAGKAINRKSATGDLQLRQQAAPAAHVRVPGRPADPGPHRCRRRLRPGDGGLRARRRDLQDAGRRADGEPAHRPRPGDPRVEAARHHAHQAAARSGCELLWANEVAALPVGIPGEALDDDQVRHAGIVAALDDPELGPIEVVGPSVLLSASPGRDRRPGADARRRRRRPSAPTAGARDGLPDRRRRHAAGPPARRRPDRRVGDVLRRAVRRTACCRTSAPR